MQLAAVFTNFGPYHLARLRALADRLGRSGAKLRAYEMAGTERLYPWVVAQRKEPFDWITLFPDRDLESLSKLHCARAMTRVLDRDQPDAVAVAGYARPESLAALAWARRQGRPVILMSETQGLDYRRAWWREALKGRLVRRFDSALVGGPRQRDYLIGLGMPPERIALGYNAVDNLQYARRAEAARRSPKGRQGLPTRPYFLAVNRFAPEKNLPALVRAFAAYRASEPDGQAWDLALCGGGPDEAEVDVAVREAGLAHAVHRPGFLQADELTRWYAFASAFVHPSLLEPWGLVVNEAAACSLPLLISDRAGCVDTLVPDPPGTTGRRFNSSNSHDLRENLRWMASLPRDAREAMGRRASAVVADWGPERFALGMVEALRAAGSPTPSSPSFPLIRRPERLAREGVSP
jgi:glycosyltransferase involved in cell wall biosynthesis